jgi:hypothetical protein
MYLCDWRWRFSNLVLIEFCKSYKCIDSNLLVKVKELSDLIALLFWLCQVNIDTKHFAGIYFVFLCPPCTVKCYDGLNSSI